MPRVLVVEDDADTREALVDCLADSGFAVTMASDGFAALECAQSLEIDLVLLDVVMPGMDGQQFMAELRKIPGYADTPVIVTTGRTNVRVTGADARLDKPFDVDELIEAVRRCLGVGRGLDGDGNESQVPS